MSEMVEGKGAVNLLDYKERFYEQLDDPEIAQRKFEGWCCRMKDMLIEQSGIQLRPYQKRFSDKIVKSVVRNDGQMFIGEWARQCLDKDTVVLDFDGSACRIKDHPRAWKTGVKDAYKLKVEGGYEIVATDNHPFWSPEEDGFVELGDVEEGDLLGVTDGIHGQWAGTDYFESSYDKFVNVHRSDEVHLREKVTEDFMKFLGLMTADGTGYESWSDQSVKFTNTNRDYCKWVAEFAAERWNIDPQWYEKGSGWDVILSTGDNGATNPVKEAFRTVNLDDGFPTAVFETNEKMVASFLNGLWAGDGNISSIDESRDRTGGRVSIGVAAGNREVHARYIQQLLQKCGVECRVKKEVMEKTTEGEEFCRVLTNSTHGAKSFFELMDPVMGKERQYREVEQLVEEREGRGRRTYGSHREETGEDVVYRRVKSIEYVGEREVWDVRYPGKDWFIGHGFKTHNSGKTETLASTGYAISVLFAPIRIGIFGPKRRQAQIMWNRVKDRYNPELFKAMDLEVEKYGGNTFQMSNGSVVQAITCGSGNIEGETFDLIFIDETQKISRRMILSQIWPMGAETNATRVCIGTPNFEDCWFREQIYRLKDTPFAMLFDWRTAAKYSKNYREYISKMLNEMTPESDEFRTQFKLEWILEEGMFLTEDDWRRMTPPPMMTPYVNEHEIRDDKTRHNWQIRAGLDLAKKQDATVLTITGKYDGSWKPYHDDLDEDTIILLDIVELEGVDYPDQFDLIEDVLNTWHADMVAVDSTGLGDPVTDVLKRRMDQHVEGIRFSAQSKHDMYKHAERKINVHKDRDYCNFVIPKEVREKDNLQVQLRKAKRQWLSLTKDYNESRMTVEAPEGEKDDHPDSSVLSMWIQDADYNVDDRHLTSGSPVLGTLGKAY